MRARKKYKFQGGIQRINNDTPDYTGAYKIRAEQDAKAQMGGSVAATAANIAMPGLGTALQGVGAISDAAFKDAKGNYKNKFSEIANTYTNPAATAGKALSALTGDKTAAADLFSGLGVTAGLKALGVKNPFGKTTQEKVKDEAVKQEGITKMFNINKRYSEATATDAQSALAKKGKYKLKTGASAFKQPRMIETEGREPIFSPKKADGTRDLLYYNPNDPTHEQGGVKAVVMPKAQWGKNSVVAQPSSTRVTKPVVNFKENPKLANLKKAYYKSKSEKEAMNIARQIIALEKDLKDKSSLRSELDNYKKGMSSSAKWENLNTSSFNDFLETAYGRQKDMTPEQRKNITRKALEEWKQKNPLETQGEDFLEILDPTGSTSWDDVTRSTMQGESPGQVGLEMFGAVPAFGRAAKPFAGTVKLAKGAYRKALGKAKEVSDIGEKVWTPTIGAYNKAKKYASKTLNSITSTADEVGDYLTANSLISDLFPSKPESNKTVKKAHGAKQLKVNTLNNTAVSQNLGGMPAANAANNFMQPTTGIQQVARNIPEYRRKATIKKPMSHRKENPDTNRVITPPTRFDDRPKQPISGQNNNFKKGGKYIKTYQIGTDGTEANATYKHSKTFKDRMAYQEASKAHDDSLSLYKQSRYFTNLINKSNLYQPTVENPPVKNVVRTGKSTVSSPTKPFGAPDDRNESFITIAGYNPVRKDLHSRKESKYKSFKEFEDAKAAGKNDVGHEGYEINMYKHPEMAVNYDPDTVSPIKVRTPKLKIPKDSIVTQTPKQVVIPNTKTPTKDKEEVVTNKPRGKYIAKEKTTLEKLGEKASQFFNKIGSSNRPVNGRKITVFK